MERVVGVDVGGTNIQVGEVDGHRRVVKRHKRRTPRSVDELLDTVGELVDKLDHRPDAVGIGIPGIVHEGEVFSAPNLVGWQRTTPIVDMLEKRLGCRVVLGNDATVGLLGEWKAGAGKGFRHLLGVWLGTGVGAGMVLDGKLYEGIRGSAGEFGHICVRPGGAMCGCGRRGCVEAYAGRRSMGHTAEMWAANGKHTALFRIRDEKGKEALTSSVWSDALDEGDELAHKLIDEAIAALGVAIGASINLLDVDRVILGGGMAEKLGQPLADRIGEATAPYILHAPDERSFAASVLGDDAGVVGAAEIARSVPLD
ncbi:MAG: ROK family protein [Actinomycetota bacterium]|nr:ROK family protein [Actinomycetota bacterium]